jgi:hypothetical protein
MTAQFPALPSLTFLPHIFLYNVNLLAAVPNSFLSYLVTASLQQFFGFPTGRLLYSLLFLLRFSVVNSIHPHCKCVQPIPVFTVQHVLPRVVCIRVIIDYVSTADIAQWVFQPWPIYCSKYFSVQRLQRTVIFLDIIQLPHGEHEMSVTILLYILTLSKLFMSTTGL